MRQGEPMKYRDLFVVVLDWHVKRSKTNINKDFPKNSKIPSIYLNFNISYISKPLINKI